MASETMPSRNTPGVEPPAMMEQQRVQASPTSAEGLPTGIDTSINQTYTPLGDGNEVPVDQIKKPSEAKRDDPNTNAVELPPHSPTFKEQVYGYAKLIRGKVLGKPDVREEGEQVLRGEHGIPERRGSQSSK